MIIYEKTNKFSYWLQLQNDDAMLHVDVFCYYLAIVMTM